MYIYNRDYCAVSHVKVGKQAARVAEIIKADGGITRLTAMHYGIANVTARIAELRTAGVNVLCEMKKDQNAREYGRWTFPSNLELVPQE
jgi:hypothetical protein